MGGDAFVEGGNWAVKIVQFLTDEQNLKWMEHTVTEKMDKGDVPTYIDLDMEAFFQSTETGDAAAMLAKRTRLVQTLSENLLRGGNMKSQSEAKYSTVKRTIGALKFILPKALSTAAYFFPVLGRAGAPTVAWQMDKILDGIDQIKADVDRLTTSDYESAMQGFKDILIDLTNDVFPDLADVKDVFGKAKDGYNKLSETKIEWKLELIKVEMFCILYQHCYDQESCSILPYDKVPQKHKNSIRDKFTERLKKLQQLAEVSRLDYHAEKTSRTNSQLKSILGAQNHQSFRQLQKQFVEPDLEDHQNMMDTIDHIKQMSYSHIIIKDTIYTVNDYAVKMWSLKRFMVPEGVGDAISSSSNIIKPTSVSLTLQASIYKDKNSNWFLKVHLPSEEDYDDITVLCMYQAKEDKKGKEPAIFIPSKLDNKSWKVDMSFSSNQDDVISFFMCKPGRAEINLPLTVEIDETRETIDTLVPFQKAEFELMRNGFNSNTILEMKSHSVMTVIGFMNLTNTTLKVSPPALVSGCTSSANPWPTELPPLQVVNMVARKQSFSARGCVGATVLTISPVLKIMLYWSTPFDHNLYDNCFGIGFYSDSFDSFSKNLLETISKLPDDPPSGVEFVPHQAKDGPVCIKLAENLMLSVKMTTDYKAAIDIILYSV